MMCGIGADVYITENNAQKYEHMRVIEYDRISALIADLDGKPGTSFDDWAIVYEKTFGYPFDPFICDPSKLSFEELRRIDVDKLKGR